MSHLHLMRACAAALLVSACAPTVDEPEPLGAGSSAVVADDPRVLERGEIACEPAVGVTAIGPFDSTYELALEPAGGCSGRLGFTRGGPLTEVIDATPRTYGLAQGVTLTDGTRVVCANVFDAWESGEALPAGEPIYRLAQADIYCSTDASGAWTPMRPVVTAHPDAAWLQDVTLEGTELVVGFRRDSRFAFLDLNGRGRPDTDGAYHAVLGIESGSVVNRDVLYDEGYPFGPNQQIPEAPAP